MTATELQKPAQMTSRKGNKRSGQSRRRIRPKFFIGTGIILGILLLVWAAPVIAPYDPTQMIVQSRLAPPSAEHLFGTDAFGRDMFSRVLHGGQITLKIAFGALLIASTFGILLGSLAGLYGGWFERILTQVMDGWLALPGVLLAIIFVVAFGRGDIVLMVALGASGVPNNYRLSRIETQRAATREYIVSARALGASRSHILIHHIFPEIFPVLSVVVALRMASLLITVSSLSFIGLGAPPPSPEWGALLTDGRSNMHNAPWLMFYPGVAIFVSVYAVNLFSDGLRDWFDPHSV